MGFFSERISLFRGEFLAALFLVVHALHESLEFFQASRDLLVRCRVGCCHHWADLPINYLEATKNIAYISQAGDYNKVALLRRATFYEA